MNAHELQLPDGLAPGEKQVRAAGGKLAIVNLQKTPKDRRAALVLRARADRVMAALMAALALQACPLSREATGYRDLESRV